MAGATFRLYGEPLSQVLFEKEIERVGVAANDRAVVRAEENVLTSRGLSALSAAVAQGAVVALRHGSVDENVENVPLYLAPVGLRNGSVDVKVENVPLDLAPDVERECASLAFRRACTDALLASTDWPTSAHGVRFFASMHGAELNALRVRINDVISDVDARATLTAQLVELPSGTSDAAGKLALGVVRRALRWLAGPKIEKVAPLSMSRIEDWATQAGLTTPREVHMSAVGRPAIVLMTPPAISAELGAFVQSVLPRLPRNFLLPATKFEHFWICWQESEPQPEHLRFAWFKAWRFDDAEIARLVGVAQKATQLQVVDLSCAKNVTLELIEQLAATTVRVIGVTDIDFDRDCLSPTARSKCVDDRESEDHVDLRAYVDAAMFFAGDHTF